MAYMLAVAYMRVNGLVVPAERLKRVFDALWREEPGPMSPQNIFDGWVPARAFGASGTTGAAPLRIAWRASAGRLAERTLAPLVEELGELLLPQAEVFEQRAVAKSERAIQAHENAAAFAGIVES